METGYARILGARFALAFILAAISGCSLEFLATGVEPSYEERSCATSSTDFSALPAIYLVNLGWHTGIVLESARVSSELKRVIREFKKYPWVEIGWGERDFYMSSGYSVWSGIKAVLYSDKSVIHVAAFNSDLKDYLSREQVVRLVLEPEGHSRLLTFIGQSIELDENGSVVPLGESLYGKGHFYPAKGSFGLSYTCNSRSAEALVEAGCNIKVDLLRSKTLIERVRRLPPVHLQ